MKTIIPLIGIIGFLVCLYFMERTEQGIHKFDSSFKLLDMQFHYNSSTVYHTFENIGEYGRKAYRNYLLIDFLFIACFLIVQITITKALGSASSIQNILFVFSVLRATFDVIENTILLYLMSRYSTKYVALADFCSYITTAKFVMLFLWVGGVLIILFTLLVRKLVKS